MRGALLTESELIDAIMPVAGACRSFASWSRNTVLMEKTNFKRSGLERMRDQDLEDYASAVLGIATSNTAGVLPRGATAKRMSALTTKIDAYKEARAAQGAGVPRRKGASKSLEDLFKEADRLLRDDIDPLMENMAQDNPQLYAEYKAARRIDDIGTRHRPPENPPDQPQLPAK